MIYTVYREGKGFMCMDDDIVGNSYDQVVDEFTVTFDKESDALFNCSSGDIVIPINLPLKE
jgi:hypothetical protein